MFKSMASCSNQLRTTVLNSFKPKSKDVDKMEMCMSPDQFYRQFNTPLALVRLSSHAPRINRTKPGDRGHEFSEWLLLAESCYQLWIDPIHKDRFYVELKTFRTINPAQNPWVSTYGSAYIPIPVLHWCLKKSKCTTIRYKAYGQKMELGLAISMGCDATDNYHPMAHLNEWDIGVTYQSPHIILFKPGVGHTKGTTHYPMITPASRGFGSIQTSITWNDTLYKVKIYPRLVHVIKSFNSRLQGEVLKTLRGVRRRANASVNMIQTLSQVPATEIGGFRIELSIQAPTLDIARQWVENTPLLDIGFWINPTADGNSPRVNIMTTTQEGLLLNANWIVQRATSKKVFQGTDAHKPTNLQRQVTADILASFGWNAGRYRITKLDDKTAWYRTTTDGLVHPSPELPQPDQVPAGSHRRQPVNTKGPDTSVGQVLAHLNKNFTGDGGTKALVAILRKHHPLGYIPCQKDQSHGYEIWGWQPFRMRCHVRTCKNNLNLGNSYIWFADLIVTGQVPAHLFGLPAVAGPAQPTTTNTPVQSKSQMVKRPAASQLIHRQPNTSKALQFKGALQGVPPTPATHFTDKIPFSKVELVPGSIPPAYHTSWTAKDGNCMFQAIAIGLGPPKEAADVRRTAIRYMGTHTENFMPFIEVGPEGTQVAFKNYLSKMSKSGEWGDDLVLTALCKSYKLRISVLKRRPNGTLFWTHKGDADHPKCLWLYLTNNHYENLYSHKQLQVD